MLPLIELEGTPYEQGLIHGRLARQQIEHNLAVYFERFQSEGKLTSKEVLKRAGAYWEVLPEQNPDYAEALLGLAEGCGCDLIELVALNVRYEIIYHQFTEEALGRLDCTALAVLPELTAEGHLLMGQNWDWIPQIEGLLLHVREGDIELLCFTEAGIVGGKLGLNSWGLGLVINGLISTDDDWSRLQKPFHVRCYEILRAKDLDEAVGIITRGERSCSANFLLAQVDAQAVDVEAAPLATRSLAPQGGFLAHTNHFLDPSALGVIEPPTEKRPHSQHRLERVTQLLSSKRPLAVGDLQSYLRDHKGYPYSICHHIDERELPEEHYQTVVSVVMDLHERALWLGAGPPCEGDYRELRL